MKRSTSAVSAAVLPTTLDTSPPHNHLAEAHRKFPSASYRMALPPPGQSRRPRLRIPLAALALTFQLIVRPVAAQAPDIRVSGAAEYEGCRIELEHVATIGTADDEHLYRQFSQIVRGPGSYYYVADGYTPGVILVYDSTGTFTRTIGRSGRGPGELAGEVLIGVSPDDSLYVASNGRITIFSASDGTAARSWNHGVNLWDLAVLQPGIIAAGRAPNTDLETVRIFNADGSRRATIHHDGILQHRHQIAQRLHLAGDTLLLVSDVGRYRLRAFDPDGRRRWTVEREVDWFPPYARQPRGAVIRVPSLPDVVGAWIESDRYLWVLLERPAANWKPVENLREPDFNTVLGSHLEVIDLQSGRVIASRRLDWLRPAGGGQPFLYTARYADMGHVVFDVWHVKIAH
jgi:hypothetical protein